MILVACLGKTPRLFLDFLSSLSRREVRSRLTFREHEEKVSISRLVGQQLGTCCHSDDRLSLPTPFPTHSRALGGHLSHHLTPAPQRMEKGKEEKGERGEGREMREEIEEAEPCRGYKKCEFAINHPIVSISGGLYSLQSAFLSITMASPHSSPIGW